MQPENPDQPPVPINSSDMMSFELPVSDGGSREVFITPEDLPYYLELRRQTLAQQQHQPSNSGSNGPKSVPAAQDSLLMPYGPGQATPGSSASADSLSTDL